MRLRSARSIAGGREWFAGQYMVRHNLHVAEVAATHHIAIDAHEPVKDTGLRRTWPNMISREGARGQEYNAWGKPTNPPEHTVILPFTRMLGGPMDFTPGIFDVAHGQQDVSRRVQSTVATQLAEYVVLYSPIQMAADLPENYEARLDAFQFIRDVPTDWETSKTLQGDIGEFIVVARLQRGGKDWFLGALTNENARKLTQPLSFLASDKQYEAQIYRDGPGADYRTNPQALTMRPTVAVTPAAKGGGFNTPSDPNLLASHAYAVLGFKASGKTPTVNLFDCATEIAFDLALSIFLTDFSDVVAKNEI